MNYDSKEDKVLLAIIALLSVILIYLIVWTFKYDGDTLETQENSSNNNTQAIDSGKSTDISNYPVLATTTILATSTLIDLGTSTTTSYSASSSQAIVTEIMPDATTTADTATNSTAIDKPVKTYEYIEIVEGCGVHFGGECLNVRSGPGTSYPSVYKLRTGVVLKTSEKVAGVDGRDWYKITFDEWIRYPERMGGDWYVAADYVRAFTDPGVQTLDKADTSTTTKKIVVDISDQMMYAYEGDTLFMSKSVSTGIATSPTPKGYFKIFKKLPSRYMQGPLPGISDDYYDLPGVPYTMYFTAQGAAIHGAFWHDNFGSLHSHGCVNLPLDDARNLYYWTDLGTPVIVRQ